MAEPFDSFDEFEEPKKEVCKPIPVKKEKKEPEEKAIEEKKEKVSIPKSKKKQ